MIHPLFISQNKTMSGNVPANDYIEFEIDSSSGTFIIPFSQQIRNGAPWSHSIYVNGDFKAESVGTVTYTAGTGYTLTGLSGSVSVIKITPGTGGSAVLGWGSAFGFHSNTQGCNALVNKNKLLRIINDPDYAHCQPGTSGASGLYFRMFQYYGCENLTNTAEEGLPNNITVIDGNFRNGQYFGCTKIVTPAEEKLNNNITTIGNNFRASQYRGAGLTQGTREHMPSSIVSFGQAIRTRQYQDCPMLVGEYIHSPQFPTLLNTYATNFQYMFVRATTPITTVDTMPKYYGSYDETSTLPVTDVAPTAVKQYITNRTGIVGYDTLNANWK